MGSGSFGGGGAGNPTFTLMVSSSSPICHWEDEKSLESFKRHEKIAEVFGSFF